MEKKYVAYYKLNCADNQDLARQQACVHGLCLDGCIIDEVVVQPEEQYMPHFRRAIETARRQKATLIVSNTQQQISRYSFGA